MRILRAIGWMPALLLAGAAYAHGVHTQVVAGATTTITCEHEDGSPLVGASWTALGPDGAVFATGRTDAQGGAVFRPDRAGAWRVRVASADGHGVVVNVDIAAAGRPEGEAEAVPPREAAHADTHDPARPAFHLTRSAAGFAALCVGLGLVYFVLRWRKA